MNLLPDTHGFLWSLFTPDKLSKAAVREIKSPNNDVAVSVVTFWEISLNLLKDFKFDEEMQRIFDDGKIEEFTSKLDKKEPELPVLCGGSWFDGRDVARCAFRGRNDPYTRYYAFGFRCARTITL